MIKNFILYYIVLYGVFVFIWSVGVVIRKYILWECCWWIILLVDSKFLEINLVYDVKDGEYCREENFVCNI